MADYTEDQLFAKLERADAAGDSEAAGAIADEIRRVRGASAVSPKAALKADFTGVTAQVDTTASVPGVRRDLGLSARNVVEGAGDLVGIVADPFIHAYNWLGEKGPTQKSLITGQPERRWPAQATTREGWG